MLCTTWKTYCQSISFEVRHIDLQNTGKKVTQTATLDKQQLLNTGENSKNKKQNHLHQYQARATNKNRWKNHRSLHSHSHYGHIRRTAPCQTEPELVQLRVDGREEPVIRMRWPGPLSFLFIYYIYIYVYNISYIYTHIYIYIHLFFCFVFSPCRGDNKRATGGAGGKMALDLFGAFDSGVFMTHPKIGAGLFKWQRLPFVTSGEEDIGLPMFLGCLCQTRT